MGLRERLARAKRKAAAATPKSHPPLVVIAVTAAAGEPTGRWVRADGATVGVRSADGGVPPLPGDPLVIGGEIDADGLMDWWAFVPDRPRTVEGRRGGRRADARGLGLR